MERETSDMSIGDGGNTPHPTPTRLFGDEESCTPFSSQETESESTLGGSEGIPSTSNIVLPERGDIDGSEILAVRRLLCKIRRRITYLVTKSHELTFLDDEWWECINEIEALGNTIQALQREYRSD